MESGAEDFFECIQIGARIKYEVIKKYPGMLEYMMNLAKESDVEMIAELKNTDGGEIKDVLSPFYANVDWGRLKPEITPATVMNLANWISYGISHSEEFSTKPWKDLVAEHSRYLEIIKQAVYKEEYL